MHFLITYLVFITFFAFFLPKKLLFIFAAMLIQPLLLDLLIIKATKSHIIHCDVENNEIAKKTYFEIAAVVGKSLNSL